MQALIVSLAAQHVPPEKAICIVKQMYSIDWITFAYLWNNALRVIA